MPLVNPAESQCSGFLFVRVPETNQHEKHKAGNRKEGQRKQNTANHWCPLFSYPLPSITLERSSREKGCPPPTYVAGRMRIPNCSQPMRGADIIGGKDFSHSRCLGLDL